MIAKDFPDATAERITFATLRERYPSNRMLHAIAQANLRRAAEYRCLIEGVPVIVTRSLEQPE